MKDAERLDGKRMERDLTHCLSLVIAYSTGLGAMTHDRSKPYTLTDFQALCDKRFYTDTEDEPPQPEFWLEVAGHALSAILEAIGNRK